MKKNFVLDTNVLLHDPESMFVFEDNDVIIPIYVIEEIDTFKKEMSGLGSNARKVSRNLDRLRHHGSLVDGVPIDDAHSGRLRVAFTKRELSNEFALSSSSADSRILATAMEVQAREPEVPLVFISKDINLRIRAAAMGFEVEDYDVERSDISELFSGVYDFAVSKEALDALYEKGEAALPEPEAEPFAPGSFGVVTEAGGNGSALVRVYPAENKMTLLKGKGPAAWGIRPRNKEQRFALELLLDDAVRLVTLVGKAGTGKTLIALAAGLERVAEKQSFQRLLVSRPVFPMGRDIGFLPGDMDDKLRPWMQPIHDNLELLLGITGADPQKGRTPNELFDMNLIHIEALTYIRGRSIPNQFILVDESQNLTPHEVKTIITRVGEGTKIVLTGDPYQIDNPYVDATNNGLVHVVNRFRNDGISGHVTLAKGERSDLAERAANLL